jgi:hypothetical protein
MRPGNNNRRGRNRGQRKPHGGIPNKNQSYDGGGSETRVRGNVYQVLEKYLQLARDAGVSGDRIAAENYLQHADHYYRVIQSMNDGQRPRVGGRDISVADFNVQNVSQGLSAALYTGGQAPQPNMNDGGNPNPNPPQGNGGNTSAGANASEGGNGGEGDGEGDDGGEFTQQQGRNQRPRHHNRQENRAGQYGNGQYNGGNANGAAAAAPVSTAEPVAATGEAPAATATAVGGDDQPDYPEDLLPPVAGADSAPREDGRSGGPRPRGRQRSRRPRPDAAAEGSAEPALPGVEGNE